MTENREQISRDLDTVERGFVPFCHGQLNEPRLTLVGLGYLTAAHITSETLAHITNADAFFFLTDEPVTIAWLNQVKPGGVPLSRFAQKGRLLEDCCNDMVQCVIAETRRGKNVCVAFAGHPGVGVYPTREIVRRARAEGIQVRMIPAISAADCLFADLGVDPGSGCQFFAAGELLRRACRLDAQSHVIIFEPGAIGITRCRTDGRVPRLGVRRLVDRLLKFYPASHQIVIYEAAAIAIAGPRIEPTTLDRLPKAALTPISTLYIPPRG